MATVVPQDQRELQLLAPEAKIEQITTTVRAALEDRRARA